MKEARLTVQSSVGLHARPATKFVGKAKEFASDIRITNLTRGGDPADAKSIIFVIKAAVANGHEILITADGPDEDAAVEALVDLVEHGLEG